MCNFIEKVYQDLVPLLYNRKKRYYGILVGLYFSTSVYINMLLKNLCVNILLWVDSPGHLVDSVTIFAKRKLLQIGSCLPGT